MGIIQRQALKNFIISYTGIAIGFVTTIFIQPHYLNTEEIGLIRVLFSFAFLLSIIAGMGMGANIIRFFPKFMNKANGHGGFLGFSLLAVLLSLTMVLVLLGSGSKFVTAAYTRNTPLFGEYFGCAFYLVSFLVLNTLFTAWSNANLRTAVPSFINDILVRLLLVSIILLYAFHYLSFGSFMIAFVSIYGLQVILVFAYVKLIDKPSFKPDWKKMREHGINRMLKYSGSLAISGMAIIGLKTVDVIIVGKFSLSDAGIYSVAAFIPFLIDSPLQALGRITGPMISRSWHEGNTENLKAIYQKSSKYLFILGGFLFLLVTLSIGDLYDWLGKPEFKSGINVVYILAVSTCFTMANGNNDDLIFNSDKSSLGFKLVLSVFVLTALGCFISGVMFYDHLMEAVACTMLAGNLVYNSCKLILIRSHFGLNPFGRYTVITLVIILSVFMVTRFIPIHLTPFLNLLSKSLLITLLYGLALHFTGLLRELYSKETFRLF